MKFPLAGAPRGSSCNSPASNMPAKASATHWHAYASQRQRALRIGGEDGLAPNWNALSIESRTLQQPRRDHESSYRKPSFGSWRIAQGRMMRESRHLQRDDPDPPMPPSQTPPTPVTEPPDAPTTEPESPVREPGPTPPKRF